MDRRPQGGETRSQAPPEELTAPLTQAGAASRGWNQPASSTGGPEDAKAFLWDSSGTRWVQAKASLLCTADPSHKRWPSRIWLWGHRQNTPSNTLQAAPNTRLTVSQRVNRIRKEEQNFPICNNMDVLGGRDAERNKSQRDKYCMTPLTVESKKYNKLGNITKKMEQTSGYVQGSGARAI